MDYIKPLEVVQNMVAAGDSKVALPIRDLMIRGILSGALLGRCHQPGHYRPAQTGCPWWARSCFQWAS